MITAHAQESRSRVPQPQSSFGLMKSAFLSNVIYSMGGRWGGVEVAFLFSSSSLSFLEVTLCPNVDKTGFLPRRSGAGVEDPLSATCLLQLRRG